MHSGAANWQEWKEKKYHVRTSRRFKPPARKLWLGFGTGSRHVHLLLISPDVRVHLRDMREEAVLTSFKMYKDPAPASASGADGGGLFLGDAAGSGGDRDYGVPLYM